MSLPELIQRIRKREKTITANERKERLIRARILDAEGCFDAQFFSSRQASSDSKK
ncbi:hypothetical protein [Neptuniibacter sp.]|uniref:hypothetical protein n=1 Tax=Neptuniibacter sp. TaxID=1962643 RepID=UPI003B5B9DB4